MKNCEFECDEMRSEIKGLKLEISTLKKQVILKTFIIIIFKRPQLRTTPLIYTLMNVKKTSI